MIFLTVVTNGYVLITLTGAYEENIDICFALHTDFEIAQPFHL